MKHRTRLWLASCYLLACCATTWAAPYLPQTDQDILERLPASVNLASGELRLMQSQLQSEPNNLPLAVQIADRFLDIARKEADPRYYGYAEAAVKPWLQSVQPPVAALRVRAVLRQHRHEFEGALADLAQVIAVMPNNRQAWLDQAIIQSVRGDYPAALRSCLLLKRLSASLAAQTCIAHVASLSGSGAQAYRQLLQTLNASPQADAESRLWALTVLAEIAVREGQSEVAEGHFRQALALGRRDVYLLGAYGDFLLDSGRPQAVVALLQDDTRPDGLLLRLALAEQASAAPGLQEHMAELRRRMDAYRLRGETIHQREEARFTLYLAQQPHVALVLAQKNWQVQREPWDARLLLEAAGQAGDQAAAQPVLAWLRQTRLEDKQLTASLSKWGRAS